ncbi:hypothetical protein [Serpentinicella alkaliphila]|uniref:Uncharacterized protein n=1 Tax=Serpentinicella alkaliphila TaxID=1734049 RepID=A0A4R2T393_9FIRM|nr:hypothetical protein [Serpentinicella alkaliphila]QUH25849.1 hypothetical protein HZR23_08945 [Serpentinicella alkaliphila]TCP95304.1 hypothetical protein EDD79_106110 [Serpentinicella alkaliphila]
MSTHIISIIITLLITPLLITYLLSLRTKVFDKYFKLNLEESYNLADLFPIKIKGQITCKVNYLDIPYEDLSIEINTKVIRGTIKNNIVSIELIKLSDRRKALFLVKKDYLKTVNSYINETVNKKKHYIELINLSDKEKQTIQKVACNACMNKIQCQIDFNSCNYKKLNKDLLLNKGLKVNSNKNYELNNTLN